MKLHLTLIGVVVVLGLIGLYLSCFVVYETQQAVVTEFGKPVKVIVGRLSPELWQRLQQEIAEYEKKVDTKIELHHGAGLYFKTPLVQQVNFCEGRLMEYDSAPTDIVTQDKKHLLVDNFAQWRIYNPLLFLQTAQTVNGIQARLDDTVYSYVRSELGQHNLNEIIRSTNRPLQSPELGQEAQQETEPIGIGREEIMNRVLTPSREAGYAFGIDIVDVRIMRADLPQENKQSIFGRMNAERQRIATKYEEEGKREATKIRAETDRDVRVILAKARGEADRIRGEGDAEALQDFAYGFTITDGSQAGMKVQGYQADPDFFRFQRSLETLTRTSDASTEFILSTSNELFQHLDERK